MIKLIKNKIKNPFIPITKGRKEYFRGTTQINTWFTLSIRNINQYDIRYRPILTPWPRLSLLSVKISVRDSGMFFN